MSRLMIVESPAKAKKIAGFLGAGWRVEATGGHLRDLPESELGVDLNADFQPQYAVLTGKGARVTQLVKALRNAREVYLATDPDREGEAIAWHLLALAGKLERVQVYRVTFNAVTAEAINAALAAPRALDLALVEAQQARRVIDRLVGYLVSPLASRALDGTHAAGRVQSAALRLLVEREREIAAFQAQPYWTLTVALHDADGQPFTATLHHPKGHALRFGALKQAQGWQQRLQRAAFWVEKSAQTLKLRSPHPPLTTATLQQAAASRLGFRPQHSMALAQALYQAGHITYPRTDSCALAPEAVIAARDFIQQTYGDAYLPPVPPTYQHSAPHAQEAHEAIRPTDVHCTQLEDVDADAAALYALIWRRFVASQLLAARYTVQVAQLQAGSNREQPFPLHLRAQQRTRTFDGWLRLDPTPDEEDDDDANLPPLREGQPLRLHNLTCTEGSTRAPARYTAATLIEALVRLGIGRPATFASTLEALHTRGYLHEQGGQLAPSAAGVALCEFVVGQFPRLFALDYTAQLEADLDRIAAGVLGRLSAAVASRRAGSARAMSDLPPPAAHAALWTLLNGLAQPADEPQRPHRFTVRLSPAELHTLEALSARWQLDKSATLRRALQAAHDKEPTDV